GGGGGGGALLGTPLVLWGAGRLASPRAALSVALWALWALCLAAEETLIAVRPNTALLHAALYVGSAAVTWLALALAARRAPLARLALAALALALAAVDRYALAGLYEGVHAWLFGLALASLAVAASAGGGRGAGGRGAAAAAAAAVAVVAVAVAGAARQGAHRPTRAALQRSQVGGRALALALSARERLGGGGAARAGRDPRARHPALEFERRHGAPVPASLRRPHVVLITIDALRAQALYPKPSYMPALSALADEGALFTHAYAAGSRTAIGMTSVHFGLYSREVEWEKWLYRSGKVLSPRSRQGRALLRQGGRLVYTTIPRSPPHGRLAERLRDAGYRGAAAPYVGYNDFFRRGVGFERGFEVFRDLSEVRWPKESAPKVTEAALGALDELLGGAPAARARPLFLWAHYYDPHESRGDPKRYRALAGVTDAALADLLAGLKARGVLDEALVLVTSDHGEAMREHGVTGHATSLFEEQVRVPLVLWLGEGLRAAARAEGLRLSPRVVRHPVSHVDVAPTLAAAAGARAEGLSGLNLLPTLLTGAPAPRRAILAELHRYVGSGGALSSDLTAAWLDGWKLVVDHRRGEESLFHLRQDRQERRNLAEEAEEEEEQEQEQEQKAAEGAGGAEGAARREAGARLRELRALVEAFRARGAPLP
ncbi:MAG: DUF1501 domain-containing protein, partial [Deltaproteobacteria bacterium]|nr:DUF1501 domain-containing protein [Deltaproteobacteria bacterium]